MDGVQQRLDQLRGPVAAQQLGVGQRHREDDAAEHDDHDPAATEPVEAGTKAVDDTEHPSQGQPEGRVLEPGDRDRRFEADGGQRTDAGEHHRQDTLAHGAHEGHRRHGRHHRENRSDDAGRHRSAGAQVVAVGDDHPHADGHREDPEDERSPAGARRQTPRVGARHRDSAGPAEPFGAHRHHGADECGQPGTHDHQPGDHRDPRLRQPAQAGRPRAHGDAVAAPLTARLRRLALVGRPGLPGQLCRAPSRQSRRPGGATTTGFSGHNA